MSLCEEGDASSSAYLGLVALIVGRGSLQLHEQVVRALVCKGGGEAALVHLLLELVLSPHCARGLVLL